jgi:hypothetical protein
MGPDRVAADIATRRTFELQRAHLTTERVSLPLALEVVHDTERRSRRIVVNIASISRDR